VHVETVRYYERRGLLRQPRRTPAGYRQYSATDLRRLQFIARAKQLGFTLTEVAGLVGERDADDHGSEVDGAHDDDADSSDAADGAGGADSVLQAARAKLHALDERQRELDETRARLARLIDICEDPTSEDCVALRVRN
jgi:DNA-binding transcriptional MerR regulator